MAEDKADASGDIKIEGNVVGSAIGSGAQSHAENVAGRNVNDNRTIIHVYGEQREITFPIVRLPFGRNLHFTGRDEVLQQTHNQLHSDRPQSVITQAIAGLGGVGKTQVALEYIYRHQTEYELISWLDADSELTLTQDMVALGQSVGVVDVLVIDQHVAVQQTRDWLSAHTAGCSW